MKSMRIICVLIGVMLPSYFCLAQESIVKVYNISDLLWARKDYPFEAGINMPPTMPPTRGDGIDPSMHRRARRVEPAKGGGGGGGGAQAAPVAAEPDPQSVIVDQLTRLVTDTIDPPSWVENGGSMGAIRVLGGMLIIRQSSPNHQAIANLLGQVRAESSRLVTVKAHWVLLSAGELEALTIKGEEQKSSAVSLVDASALAKLGDKALHYRGQTSCFNGQTVHLSSGRGRTAVTKVIAVTGDQVGLYNPEPEVVHAGAMLQLTAMLAQDDKAVVDLQSVVSEWEQAPPPIEVKEPTTRPAASTALVDRVNVLVQQLRTTVQVPMGKPVLVGGMTFEPSMKAANSPQMYLIIEVSAGN